MTTFARSLLDKENVIGDVSKGALRLEAKMAGDTVAHAGIKASSSVSCLKSTSSTPRGSLVDTNRRVLGNVGNSTKSNVTSNEMNKPKLYVPQTPNSAPTKSLFKNPKPVVAEQPKDDLPEIENLPAAFVDDDDYEDIWPKAHRLTSAELDLLATWRPILPDVKDCVFEPDPHPLFEYEDAFEPISGYFGSQESFSISDLLDNSPMKHVPPLSPIS